MTFITLYAPLDLSLVRVTAGSKSDGIYEAMLSIGEDENNNPRWVSVLDLRWELADAGRYEATQEGLIRDRLHRWHERGGIARHRVEASSHRTLLHHLYAAYWSAVDCADDVSAESLLQAIGRLQKFEKLDD